MLKVMTGQFGRLTVLEHAGTHVAKGGGKSSLWKCQCSCGNTAVVRGAQLRNGKVRSCGCIKQEQMSKLGKLRVLAAGESQRNLVLAQYKTQASQRSLVWTISDAEFDNLTQQNCHYCGVEPSNKLSRSRLNGTFVYGGIDRKDNEQGYTRGNVVPCCAVCNRMKLALSPEEFIQHLQRILSYIEQKRPELMGVSCHTQ